MNCMFYIMRIVCVLCVLTLQGRADHKYGSLEWDHADYVQRKNIQPGRDYAMAYINDLNERIKYALDDGNVLRADYLSDVLCKLLSTGGSYGIRKTGPTANELKYINQSSTLMARSYQVKGIRFPAQIPGLENTVNLSDQEKAENFMFYKIQGINFFKRTENVPSNHVDGIRSLIVAHWKGKNGPENITMKNPQNEEDVHTLNAKTAYEWMDESSENYRDSIFSKDVSLKVFYKIRGNYRGPYRSVTCEPTYEGKNRIIFYDFIRDRKFNLFTTRNDGLCWLHALELSNNTTLEEFLNWLQSFSDEQRLEATRNMLKTFWDTLKESTYDQLNSFPRLLNLKNYVLTKNYFNEKDKENFETQVLDLDIFLDLARYILTPNEDPLKNLDANGKNRTFQDRPSPGSYAGVYTEIKRKNAVSFSIYAYHDPGSKFTYMYPHVDNFFLNGDYNNIYYFSGNSHATMLLSVLKDIPKNVNFIDQNYFGSWCAPSKNQNGSSHHSIESFIRKI